MANDNTQMTRRGVMHVGLAGALTGLAYLIGGCNYTTDLLTVKPSRLTQRDVPSERTRYTFRLESGDQTRPVISVGPYYFKRFQQGDAFTLGNTQIPPADRLDYFGIPANQVEEEMDTSARIITFNPTGDITAFVDSHYINGSFTNQSTLVSNQGFTETPVFRQTAPGGGLVKEVFDTPQFCMRMVSIGDTPYLAYAAYKPDSKKPEDIRVVLIQEPRPILDHSNGTLNFRGKRFYVSAPGKISIAQTNPHIEKRPNTVVKEAAPIVRVR